MNVWHLRAGSILTGPQISNQMANLKTFYQGVAPLLRSDVVVTSPEFLTTVEDSPQYVNPGTAWSVNGSGGYESGNAASALCISWYSATANRRGRGRTFLSPLYRNLYDGAGQLSADRVLIAQNAATALINLQTGPLPDGAFGVYSQKDKVVRDYVRAKVRRAPAILTSRRD